MKMWIFSALILFLSSNLKAATTLKLSCEDPDSDATFVSEFEPHRSGVYIAKIRASEALSGDCLIVGTRKDESFELVPSNAANQPVVPDRYYPVASDPERENFRIELGQPGRYLVVFSIESRAFIIASIDK